MQTLYQVEYGLSETPVVANQLLDIIDGNSPIIGFKGELGAGKTTLIQNLCTQLGVTQSVTSPTFSLVHEYRYPKGNIYHFDFYRLQSLDECYTIGFQEYLDSGCYCWIEWYEIVIPLLPVDFLHISIEHLGFDRRLLTLFISD